MPNNYFSEKIPIKYNMIELNQRIFGLYVTMLNDKLRNQFFYDALKKHVKGKVVLDVGSGTGLLAAYALEHGAKFVYAVEQIEQSEKVATINLNSK
jgi:predicted RNA methylase